MVSDSNNIQFQPDDDDDQHRIRRSHSPNQEIGSKSSTLTTRLPTPEAHEVQSVRKKVEGMGVETDSIESLDQTTTSVHPDSNHETYIHSSSSSSSSTTTTTPAPTHPSVDQLHHPPPADSNIPSDQPESVPKSSQIPTSWDAHTHLQSPFACFAPNSTTKNISQLSNLATPSSNPNPLSSPTKSSLARAFAPPSSTAPAFSGIFTGSSNSICPNKFPSGSDFFLKGKRNTPLSDLSPDADPDSVSQNKKLKLPSSSFSTISTSDTHPQGFASYSLPPQTDLRPDALEKLNNNPSLQAPFSTSFKKTHPPSSITSSVCAVNGEADEPGTPALSNSSAAVTTDPSPVPNSTTFLGFSAFAQSSGFGSATSSVDWSTGSVFDQEKERSKVSGESLKAHETNEWDSGKPATKKTHLALSAELSQEDKRQGFLEKEVITGEENEDLIKNVRCKIFTLGEDGSWRERGTGGLRLLRTREEPHRYRLIMRADAVLRVLLNVPIFKGFSYRATQDKFLTFASTASSRPDLPDSQPAQFQQYLCRFGKPEARQEMIDSIEECIRDLEIGSHEALKAGKRDGAGWGEDAEEGLDASDLV